MSVCLCVCVFGGEVTTADPVFGGVSYTGVCMFGGVSYTGVSVCCLCVFVCVQHGCVSVTG